MLTRRQFLTRSIAVVSVGIALPSIFLKAVDIVKDKRNTEHSEAPVVNKRTLVIVQMAGGNDGLNTLIPYTDGRYYDARPTLGIKPEQVMPLDDRIGLHPEMGPLKELWDAGVLAIVEGVGYPNPNRSHFRSMEIWQTAAIEDRATTGWLGKYFDGLDDEQNPLAGFSVGNSLPLALVGTKKAIPSVQSVETYKLQTDPRYPQDGDRRIATLLKLYAEYPTSAPYAALLDATAKTAYESVQALQRAHAMYTPAFEYPKTPFASGLRLLAEVIAQEPSATVCHIALGGFDTHANQARQQAELLKTFSEGLNVFYKDLEAHGKAQDVLVMTWSEFGRRVAENGSAGTDHGTAGPMFILGGAIKGRTFYGQPPDLGSLSEGDLRFTTDFRSVYTTVIEDWLRVPADGILGKKYPKLDFVA